MDRLEFDSDNNAIERDGPYFPKVHHQRPRNSREEERALLVADLASHTPLPVDHCNAYHDQMFRAVRDATRKARVRLLAQQLARNNFFCVLRNVGEAARMAMTLFDVIEPIHADGWSPPTYSLLRVGLHYGTVYRIKDSFFGHPQYVGPNIHHALLIEPAAPPGSAVASCNFARYLNVAAGHPYRCKYLGFRRLLAEGPDSYPLYQLVYNQSLRPAPARVA